MRIKERFKRIVVDKLAGSQNFCGIVQMNSGTSVVSVANPNAVSGSIIGLFPFGLSTAQNTTGFDIVPTSVSNGQFLIVSQGSYAPPNAMQIGYVVFNQQTK